MSREKIIDRVRKLRRLAEGNDNPHEARAALLLAGKLMEQYELAEADVVEVEPPQTAMGHPGGPAITQQWMEPLAGLTPLQRALIHAGTLLGSYWLRREGLDLGAVMDRVGKEALKAAKNAEDSRAISDLIAKMRGWVF